MIGKTILHYKIIEKLGEGGMGVVYLAEDTKLKRQVAIKFLPNHIAANSDERKRFEIEAQAAAVLNHPNIATIHNIEEADDQLFIIMEYISGKHLRDHINSKPLSIEEAIDTAIQIAQGLQEAHNNGVIHRDIKSANIMQNDKGQIKIMDFGLAKVGEGNQLTKTGTTIGTVAYMAPEQMQGGEIDHRADIWSFGVVLYEILTGQLPFQGDYEQAIQYAIINTEPEPLQYYHKKDIPQGLQNVIDKTLEKDFETRYQHVDEIIADLKRLQKTSSEISSNTDRLIYLRKSKSLFNTKNIMISIFSILGLYILFNLFSETSIQQNTIQATHTQLTFSGNAYRSVISPDGKSFAYIHAGSDNDDKIMVRDLSGGNSLEILETDMLSNPDPGFSLFWKPDGSLLTVTAKINKISESFLIPRMGGELQTIANKIIFCWSPDGSRYARGAIGSKHIILGDIYFSKETKISIIGDFNWRLNINWSPSNQHLLFKTSGLDGYAIWTIRPDGKNQQKVVHDSLKIYSPLWSKSGNAIYYLRQAGQTKNLMKQKINASTGQAIGLPLNLQSGLRADKKISLSKDNKKLLYNGISSYSNLKVLKREKGKFIEKSLTSGTSQVFTPSLSPDGQLIAFCMGNKINTNIYVLPINGGKMKQLTFLNSLNFSPAWSPDGLEIAFASNEGNSSKVWKTNLNGVQPTPIKISELSNSQMMVIWAPGDKIMYQKPGNRNFNFLDPDKDKETQLVANDSVGWMFFPIYSPDKQEIAFFWNRKNSLDGIWSVSLKDLSQKLISKEMLDPLNWSLDGEWIYAYDISKPSKIQKVNIKNGKAELFYTIPFAVEAFHTNISADGNTIVTTELTKLSDIWMMENFDPEVELE